MPVPGAGSTLVSKRVQLLHSGKTSERFAHLQSKCFSTGSSGLFGACTRALSSAVNILERLQVLTDGRPFRCLRQQSDIQDNVLAKQMASLNKSLEVLHSNHEELQTIVKEFERLYVEAMRSLSSSTNLAAHATHTGPEPTAVESVELLQDMWMMCRDELLMKIAAVSLLTMETSSADMAVLMRCYSDQPNIDAAHIQSFLALLKETAPQQ